MTTRPACDPPLNRRDRCAGESGFHGQPRGQRLLLLDNVQRVLRVCKTHWGFTEMALVRDLDGRPAPCQQSCVCSPNRFLLRWYISSETLNVSPFSSPSCAETKIGSAASPMRRPACHPRMDKTCFEGAGSLPVRLFEVGFPAAKLAAFPSAKIRCLFRNCVCKTSFNLHTAC